MAHQSSGNRAQVTSFTPDIKDPDDLTPSDSQPPGVDEDDDFPQSLEEALLGK
jgi:hypothetical protein